MTILFYVCQCLCIVIFQSTIIPHVSMFDRLYDLLIPFVTYLGLYRPARESLPLIIIFGFIMDSLTGGAFGVYLTTYVWLYAGIRWATKLIDVRSGILILLVVSLAVLFENIVLLATFVLLKPGAQLPQSAFQVVFSQMIWAFLSGPLFLIFFDYTNKRWDLWTEKLRDLRSG
jgi:cell shape-determining protein MreD